MKDARLSIKSDEILQTGMFRIARGNYRMYKPDDSDIEIGKLVVLLFWNFFSKFKNLADVTDLPIHL